MNAIRIRPSTIHDAEAITRLVKELGYSSTQNEITRSLEILRGDIGHFMVVAEVDSEVVGLIHAMLAIRLTTPKFVEIVALCVKNEYQGKGIGRALVEQALTFAGDVQVRVRCNTKRVGAHQFYEKLGFKALKEQKVLGKL